MAAVGEANASSGGQQTIVRSRPEPIFFSPMRDRGRLPELQCVTALSLGKSQLGCAGCVSCAGAGGVRPPWHSVLWSRTHGYALVSSRQRLNAFITGASPKLNKTAG